MMLNQRSDAADTAASSRVFGSERFSVHRWLMNILLLQTFTVSVAIADECPSELDYCVGAECFCSLTEAEDYLRATSPERFCLEFDSISDTSSDLPVYRYKCKPRPPESLLGTLYTATSGVAACPGGQDPLGNDVPAWFCPNESSLTDAFRDYVDNSLGCVIESWFTRDYHEPFIYAWRVHGPVLGDLPPGYSNAGLLLFNRDFADPSQTCIRDEDIRGFKVKYHPSYDGKCDPNEVRERGMGLARRQYFLCEEHFMAWVGFIDDEVFGNRPCGNNYITFDTACRNPAEGTIRVIPRQVRDCSLGNPCIPSTGNKILAQTDWNANDWEFTRHYSSAREIPARTGMGPHWTHNFDIRIDNPGTPGVLPLFVLDERNLLERYNYVSAGLYRSVTEAGNILIREADMFRLERSSGQVLEFDGNGRLIAVHYRDTPQQDKTLEYVDGRLAEVIDPFGRQLVFDYQGGRLVSVHFPDGGAVGYDYSGSDELISATYFDANINPLAERAYLYENPALPGHLTGIIDENGTRLSTYAYDGFGRVISSERAGGAGSVTIEYPSSSNGLQPDQRRVTLNGTDERLYSYTSAGNWDWFRRLTSLSSDAGVSNRFYDSNRRLERLVDESGSETRFSYDDDTLRETSRTEALGEPEQRRTERSWSETFNRVESQSVYDAGETLRSHWEHVYSARGELSAQCDYDVDNPQSLTYTCGSQSNASVGVRQTVYTRCEQVDVDAPGSTCPILGLLKTVSGPRTDIADTTHYSYYSSDASGCDTTPENCPYRKGDLRTITNPLGHVTEFLEYDDAGRPLRIRDPNGVDTIMTYHSRGWLLTQTTAGATTSYDYLPNGLVSRITQPDGSYLDFEYDAAHRLEAIENALGERIEYEFDAAGNRTAERIYDNQSTLSFELQQVYDQLGRLETTLTGTGHETGYEYDAAGNLTDVTDALDNTTSHEYDPLNRLKKTLDALGGETVFAYDARDNLVEVTDPEGLSTHYTYNAFDELVELDSPDTGVTTYTYDSAGNRLTQTDARGVTTTYSYDALNRPTAVQYPDSSLDVAYFYDEDDSVTGCSGSYPVGRLTRMTDPSGTTVYCYDARGNITHKQLPGLDVEISYEYNAADRLTAVTYPSGRKVTYSRDTAGQITSMMLMTAPFIGDPLVTNVSHLPFGPVAQYTFGNQQVLERTYNLDYHITDVTSPALELHFRRDPAGNIDRLGAAPGAATPLEEYAYDDLYRLLAVQDDLAVDIEAYAYDLIGNRQSKTTTAGTELYDYATDSHRLIEVDSNLRGYDAVGNLISDQAGSRTYTYGDHNRLTAFSDTGDNASYQYNGRGERAYKAVQSSGGGTTQSFSITNSTYFFYDEAGRLLAKHSAGMLGPIDTFREYVYLDDVPVALVEPNGDAYYLHADHLGTPRAVTDGNGTKRWEWKFQSNPFGEMLPDGDPEKTGKPFTLNLRFPGQYYDAESGLHYNYFRDYEPSIGRYVQSDPIGLYGGFDTYGYVHANPLKFSDRLGLWRLDEGNGPRDPLCALIPSRCSCDLFPDQCISLDTVQSQVIQDTQCCVEKCTAKLLAKTAMGTALGELSGMFLNRCIKKAISFTSALDFAEYLVCIEECNPEPGECR